MRVKCPNGCGVKGSGLISLGRKETQTVSCQTFFHLLVWIGTDELLERFRWEMISVCSCCLTPGHECGCNYTRMGFFCFFGGNNCSQAGGTIRRRGGKTAIDAFLLPPEKTPPRWFLFWGIVPANKLSGEQRVWGWGQNPAWDFF